MNLDAGCSANPFRKADCIGIDIVKGMGDIRGSVTHLPFKNKTFETVFCTHVLEHLNNKDRLKAIAELVRVGKKVIIKVPHALSLGAMWDITHQSYFFRRSLCFLDVKYPQSQHNYTDYKLNIVSQRINLMFLPVPFRELKVFGFMPIWFISKYTFDKIVEYLINKNEYLLKIIPAFVEIEFVVDSNINLNKKYEWGFWATCRVGE